jgi:putative SOS response-associated peptidase YedK
MPASFTILTSTANPALAKIHDRMPVILSDRERGRLDESARKRTALDESFANSGTGGFAGHTPVSPLVNSVKNQVLSCLPLAGSNSNSRLNFKISACPNCSKIVRRLSSEP